MESTDKVQLSTFKKSYQHVGVDIYPVLRGPSQIGGSYYKRKAKKYDQNATSHLLPGTQIELCAVNQ